MGSARREAGTFLCRKICKYKIIFVPLQSKTDKIFIVRVKMGRLAGMRACFCMCFVKCTLQIISNYDKFLQILSKLFAYIKYIL